MSAYHLYFATLLKLLYGDKRIIMTLLITVTVKEWRIHSHLGLLRNTQRHIWDSGLGNKRGRWRGRGNY